MQLHRSVCSSAVLVLAVTTASLCLAHVADADVDAKTIGNGSCDPGNVCMWRDADESGSLADARTCEPNWYCGIRDFSEWYYFNTTISPNDKTSSIWVRSSAQPNAMFAEHKQGGGQVLCLPLGIHFSSAELRAVGIHDEISSMWTDDTSDCDI